MIQYNTRKHSTLKITPTQAREKKMFAYVHNVLYKTYQSRGNEALVASGGLNVGDLVRVSRMKNIFEKDGHNWSEEMFVVSSVLNTSPTTYKIKDMSPKGPKVLDGSFYRDELLKTKLNVEDIFRVEKVLKVSADGKKEFVKWMGYPKAFNSWIKRVSAP